MVVPVPKDREPDAVPDPVPVSDLVPSARKPILTPKNVGVAVGVGIGYEIVKWVVATALAPETGGASWGAAAAMP